MDGPDERIFDIPEDEEAADPTNITCIAKNGRPEPTVAFYLGNIPNYILFCLFPMLCLIGNRRMDDRLVSRDYIVTGADKPLYDDMFSTKDVLNYTAVVNGNW